MKRIIAALKGKVEKVKLDRKINRVNRAIETGIDNAKDAIDRIEEEKALLMESLTEATEVQDIIIKIADKIECTEEQGEHKPNPVLDIEIPFGAKDSELQEASYYIPEGFHAEIEGNRVVMKRGEQNPAWSEEDGSHIGRIISYLESFKAYNAPHIEPIKNEIDWIESLRLQNHWKPSEYQLVSLYYAIIHCMDERIIANGLKDLFDQLKKLTC